MGRDEAFLELYRLYATRLYTYCLRVTGSADDAADALQETFTSAYSRLADEEDPIEHPAATPQRSWRVRRAVTFTRFVGEGMQAVLGHPGVVLQRPGIVALAEPHHQADITRAAQQVPVEEKGQAAKHLLLAEARQVAEIVA